MNIPEEYVVQKLFSLAHSPTYNRHSKTYTAGCPVCREGKSYGRKKRLHFYTKTLSFHCFNCNKTWSALSWIRDVSKLSLKEIKEEINSNNFRTDISNNIFASNYKNISATLPHDSINLFDNTQLDYYCNNTIVQQALSLIYNRKINTAINRPKALYISLTDSVHKNRLCIPFYDEKNHISFYQTRALDNSPPKYLSKFNSEKSVYGINNINVDLNYIFIFEGPIDAMFVKNGVAVTGLSTTQSQQQILNKFSLHKKIWVVDNQNFDIAAKQKTDELIKKQSSVFIWPENIKCKDFNELAVLLNQNSISHEFILKYSKIF